MPNPKGNPNIGKIAIEAGTTFSSTNQPKNKNGVKPSRIRAYIQENDLGSADVGAAIRSLAEMTEVELQTVYDDIEAPVLLRGFAAAIAAEIKRSGLANLEILLSRAIGKPKETIEHSGGIDITNLTKEERDAEIAALLARKKLAENASAD